MENFNWTGSLFTGFKSNNSHSMNTTAWEVLDGKIGIISCSLMGIALLEFLFSLLIVCGALYQDRSLRQGPGAILAALLVPTSLYIIANVLRVPMIYYPIYFESHLFCAIYPSLNTLSTVAISCVLGALAIQRYMVCIRNRPEMNNIKNCRLLVGLSLSLACLVTIYPAYKVSYFAIIRSVPCTPDIYVILPLDLSSSFYKMINYPVSFVSILIQVYCYSSIRKFLKKQRLGMRSDNAATRRIINSRIRQVRYFCYSIIFFTVNKINLR